MNHYLTLGYLDPEALEGCVALATRPIDEATVRRVMAEFPGVKADLKEGYVVLPWHGLGTVDQSEAFALCLQRLTGCLIADRRNGRLVEVGSLSGMERKAVGSLEVI